MKAAGFYGIAGEELERLKGRVVPCNPPVFDGMTAILCSPDVLQRLSV